MNGVGTLFFLLFSFNAYTNTPASSAYKFDCTELQRRFLHFKAYGTKAFPEQNLQFEFIPYEQVGAASGDALVLVFDEPYDPNAASKPQNVKILDHHGRYRNPLRPFDNTTSKLIDAYEKSKDKLGPSASPEQIRDQLLADIFDIDPSHPQIKNLKVSTTNLGDASLAIFLFRNPENLAEKKARDFLRQVTYHEDFGVFGTASRKKALNDSETLKAIQFSEAIMQSHDDVILSSRLNKNIEGAFVGSDRFNGKPSASAQQNILNDSQGRIQRIFQDPKFKEKLAKEFRNNTNNAATTIKAQAILSENAPEFEESRRALTPDEFNKFNRHVAVIDGTAIPPGGQFSSWGAVSAAHNKDYQIQFIPMGNKTGYIVSIPDGRKDHGAINQALLDELKAAGATNFIMRDSGLLFNFAGDTMPRAEILKILAKSMSRHLLLN